MAVLSLKCCGGLGKNILNSMFLLLLKGFFGVKKL